MREFEVGDKVRPKPEITHQDFAAVCIPKDVFDEVYKNGAIIEKIEEGSLMFHSVNGRGLWLCNKSYFEFFDLILPKHLFEI